MRTFLSHLQVSIYLFPLAFGSGKDAMLPIIKMTRPTPQQSIFTAELFGHSEGIELGKAIKLDYADPT